MGNTLVNRSSSSEALLQSGNLVSTQISYNKLCLTVMNIIAIQLARLSGFSPIITTASLKHADYLKELGATHVLERKLDASSIKAAIRQITTNPFEIGYDAVSFEDTQNLGYELIAPGGTLVLVTSIKIAEDKRSADKHIADIFAHPTLPDRRPIAAALYKHVSALFASGELKVRLRLCLLTTH